MKIRKVAAVIGVVGLLAALFTTPAFAKRGDSQLDVSLDIATEAYGGTGSTVGITVGGGTEIEDNLQIRGDISYYNWDNDVWGVDYEVTRIPVAGGVRYFFPLPPKALKVFAQGEVELSFDSVEMAIPFGFGKATADEINLGLVLGGGVDFSVSRDFSVGGLLKVHAIDGSYTTLGVSGAYHF